MIHQMSGRNLTLLRDGSTVQDSRFNRLIQFDERSRLFPIEAPRKEVRNKIWRFDHAPLDQGREGACVGFGISHELIAYPSEVQDINYDFAFKLYKEAQKIDPWPGEDYSGTSVLAGVKVAQAMGYFESYRWAFTFEDVLYGLSWSGPAVVGTYWYEGMYRPTKCCHTIYPTGSIVGGHCYLLLGVDKDNNRIIVLNSWGPNWGDNGIAYISFSDMRTILKNHGECVFFENRRKTPVV